MRASEGDLVYLAAAVGCTPPAAAGKRKAKGEACFGANAHAGISKATKDNYAGRPWGAPRVGYYGLATRA